MTKALKNNKYSVPRKIFRLLHGTSTVHERFLEDTKLSEPDVLFIGDSLIRNLSHMDMWSKMFVPMHSLNFGISGDQTQHVLWRVQNGELEHIKPKVVVLLVGTNNHGHTPEQITDGIHAIVRVIQELQPQAYIVLPTLLPRGQKPNALRERNSRVNELMATRMAGEARVQVVNIEKDLVQLDGVISPLDMEDYLHLTPSGYLKAFEPVYDLLLQLLAEGETENLEEEETDSTSSASNKPE